LQDRGDEQFRGCIVRRHGKGLLVQYDRPETARSPRPQSQCLGVAGDLLGGFDPVGKTPFDVGKVDRGCERDPALCGTADQLGDRQEWFPCQRRGWIDVGAAAIGQEEYPRSRAAILGDPLRIGEGQDSARRGRFTSPRLRGGVGALLRAG